MNGRVLAACAACAAFAALLISLGCLLAADDRPRDGNQDAADPPDRAPEGAIVVAVVDTGVDLDHPALRGKLLKGLNVANVEASPKDFVGHGTSVAGLIAAEDPDDECDGVCAGLDVRVLPVKVTPGDSGETLPSLVGVGIDRAIDAGAHVVCVAMGSSRSTDTIEKAMEKAREKGVLVVAAAGMTGGTHDLYPAAHPWALSCTSWAKTGISMEDGTFRQGVWIAERANRSGKTELMGPASAPAIVPGGTGKLDGTSVAAALVAGWAARLRLKRPDLSAAQVRAILTAAGPHQDGGNKFMFRTPRKVEPRAFERIEAAAPGKSGDLAIEWMDSMPAFAPIDKPFQYFADVRNVGDAPAGGELSLERFGGKGTWSAKFDPIAPGATKRVIVELPAMKEDVGMMTAKVKSDGDCNEFNNQLEGGLQVTGKAAKPALCRVHVFGWKSGATSAVVRGLVLNPGPERFKGKVDVEIDGKHATQDVELQPSESRSFELAFDLPEPEAAKRVLLMGVELVAGLDENPMWNIDLDLDSPLARPQYADVWSTKEVIFDAPSSVMTGRTLLPVLLFAPEIHTNLILDREKLTATARRKSSVRDSGVWLREIVIEQLSAATVLKFRPDPDQAPRTPLGRRLVRLLGGIKPVDTKTVTIETRGSGLVIEDWSGAVQQPESLDPWVNRDGHHLVFCIPREWLDVSDPEVFGLDRSRYVFLRGFANLNWLETDPSRAADRWASDDGLDSQEAVLRVQLDVGLPSLFPDGQYRDMHVHTMCEFSRDAVEPRLAFGGPWWMIVRTAHAMGFIDDATLESYRKGLQAIRGGGSSDASSAILDGRVITTDHNVFLSDEDTPDAGPFGEAGRLTEWECLRQVFGRGGNQELTMAVPRPFPGGAHALVYADRMFPGPWHGGRNFLDVLTLLDEIFSGRLTKALLGLRGAVLAEPAADQALADYLQGLAHGEGAKQRREEFRKLVQEVTGGKEVSQKAVEAFAAAWGSATSSEVRELREELSRIVSDARARESSDLRRAKLVDPACATGNPWTVPITEARLYEIGGAYVAAHPHLGAKDFTDAATFVPGMLSWEEAALPRAANVSADIAPAFEKHFPFKGVQIWNEPHFWAQSLGDPAELHALNPWRRGFMSACTGWHSELAFGLYFYFQRLAGPGLSFSPDPDRGPDQARRFFVRKVYHYAGSDAHGAFNFTTGVMATLATRPKMIPALALFGFGHDSKVHSAHYGGARVYGETRGLGGVLAGRCVCTDGPLLWAWFDADVKFDSKTLTWSESRDTPEKALDTDGQIGGEGVFDGRRTMLVRHGCAGIVARVRCAGGKGCGGDVRRAEIYGYAESQERPLREPDKGSDFTPKALHFWKPAGGGQQSFEALPFLAPTEPQLVMVAGFTGADETERFSTEHRRCFTNPVWITTVDIGASVEPVYQDGKAIVPPGKFVVTFRTDHSMLDGRDPMVVVKQLDEKGDSVVSSHRLAPSKLADGGFWKPRAREIRGRGQLVDDGEMSAANLEPIVLHRRWYRKLGEVTFALILGSPRDVNGNELNPVAGLKSVPWPGEIGEGETPLDTGSNDVDSPSIRPDTVRVTVSPGEKIELPRGGQVGETRIPPGKWAVPEGVQTKPLDVLIKMGTHVVTVTLVASGDPPSVSLVQADRGWAGVVPTPGQGAPSISVKNESANEIEIAQPIVVASTCAAFAAPETQPGECTVSVTQGGEKKTWSVEAVASRLEWDQPTAKIGDVRTLSVRLVGASKPADWTVSGNIEVTTAQVVELATGVRRQESSLIADRLPGDSGRVGSFRATREGAMTAKGWLRARRK